MGGVRDIRRQCAGCNSEGVGIELASFEPFSNDVHDPVERNAGAAWRGGLDRHKVVELKCLPLTDADPESMNRAIRTNPTFVVMFQTHRLA
jgi:hypothetical protein